MFYFDEFIARLNLPAATTRLVRHDKRGESAWNSGRFEKFGCFASFQNNARSPYLAAALACQFIPGPTLPNGDATALFLGITEIKDRWRWDGTRQPLLQDPQILESVRNNTDLEAFDLHWLDLGDDYSERILIRWGPSNATRAWSQWASNNRKEIVELRRQRSQAPFPGFSNFRAHISHILQLPDAWQAALRSCGGIYLLVADNGQQYVGSASGQDGFWGRWASYAANGHGGNVLLRQAGHNDYMVSVLEIASSDMGLSDLYTRERHWKAKLGTQAHGLNLN